MPSIPFCLLGFEVTEVIPTETHLMICATSQAEQAQCPRCHETSQRVHSYYHRWPRDVLVSSQPVQLRLRVRRFRCLNAQCPRQTFSKRLPDLVGPTARRTNRLTLLWQVFAIHSGAESGARLLTTVGTSVSPDTLLRLAKASSPRQDTFLPFLCLGLHLLLLWHFRVGSLRPWLTKRVACF